MCSFQTEKCCPAAGPGLAAGPVDQWYRLVYERPAQGRCDGAMGFPRDGCIAAHPRGVFRLRIVCVDACPELIGRCESAMAEVLPNKVTRVGKVGCTEVTAYSKHWPCLIPAWARPEA